MIVNLTKIDFATASENWSHKLKMIWNSSCCSNGTPSKNVQLWQYFVVKLFFIFQYELVPSAFILLFGDFDLILIVTTVVLKTGWICIFYVSLYQWLDKVVTFSLFQVDDN